MDRIGKNNKIRGTIKQEIKENQAVLEELLQDCEDIIHQSFSTPCGVEVYIVYVDGLADHQLVEDFVLRPLKSYEYRLQEEKENKVLDHFFKMPETKKKQVVLEIFDLVDVSWKSSYDEAVLEIMSGNTVLFMDGMKEAISISSKKFPSRGVAEAESEKTIRGSKDAFNESMRTSTALLRRRIRDPRFKIQQVFVGQRSRTNVAICYVDGLVRQEWLEELKNRLGRYEIDAIYDSAMIEQLVEPNWKSPFPQFQHTERPDKASSALLEGRIVLVVDNSPDVLILPATLNTFFQASDDYYSKYFVAIFARILRYVAAILAIGLPGFYLSVVSYHTEILPTQLVLAIAKAREGIPFPAMVEILLMELEFELLREAGIRLPGHMDNTIGVVGGLIVGQAAVEAGLVSTIVVIVVALAALASFAVPNESFMSAFRLLKFFFILLCVCFTSLFFLLLALDIYLTYFLIK